MLEMMIGTVHGFETSHFIPQSPYKRQPDMIEANRDNPIW